MKWAEKVTVGMKLVTVAAQQWPVTINSANKR